MVASAREEFKETVQETRSFLCAWNLWYRTHCLFKRKKIGNQAQEEIMLLDKLGIINVK